MANSKDAPGDAGELLSQLRIEREPFAEPPSRRWRWWLLSAALLAGLAWAYLLHREPAALSVETVQARRVQPGQASASVLDASGYVVARRRATVSSKLTGKVMELHIEEGSKVQEGDVLARIDDANIRAQVALATSQRESARTQLAEVRVQLAEAERQLRRTRELAGRKLLSDAALDTAQAQVDALRARLASAEQSVTVAERALAVQEQQLEDTVVRAPFDGVITVKNAQPGEMISPLSAGGDGTRTGIGTLVDMDSLEVEVDVNENVINRVTAQQPVETRLNAYPDWKIPSHVIAVVPTADRSKATVKVRIGLDSSDARILPEMGARVSFLERGEGLPAEEAAVRVPARAIYQEDNKDLVYVVVDGRLERRAIRTGRTLSSEIEVLAGLRGGETLAVADTAELRDGRTVSSGEGDE